MKIVLDVDGVLTEFAEWEKYWLQRTSANYVSKKPLDPAFAYCVNNWMHEFNAEVFILSARSYTNATRDLRDWLWHYKVNTSNLAGVMCGEGGGNGRDKGEVIAWLGANVVVDDDIRVLTRVWERASVYPSATLINLLHPTHPYTNQKEMDAMIPHISVMDVKVVDSWAKVASLVSSILHQAS